MSYKLSVLDNHQSLRATLFTPLSMFINAFNKLSFLPPISWQTSPLYLHCSENFSSPEQIEGHLPAHGIYGILDDLGKSRSGSIRMQVT